MLSGQLPPRSCWGGACLICDRHVNDDQPIAPSRVCTRASERALPVEQALMSRETQGREAAAGENRLAGHRERFEIVIYHYDCELRLVRRTQRTWAMRDGLGANCYAG